MIAHAVFDVPLHCLIGDEQNLPAVRQARLPDAAAADNKEKIHS